MRTTNVLRNVGRARRSVTIGIRREDPSRIWERRAPLTPDDVHDLVRTGGVSKEGGNGGGESEVGVEVLVQSCERRVWSDTEYERAGARIVPSLANHSSHVSPDIVLGVKEPPVPELDEITQGWMQVSKPQPQTHVMFSHTIKGQAYNMPLLGRFLDAHTEDTHPSAGASLRPRLIDYELLKDEETEKRSVGFGWFAGAAGVLEAFSAMAQHHLEHGVASPFLYASRPYTHRTLDELKQTLRNVGAMIADKGVPSALGPFVVGVTGEGNVAQGALDMLKELPITRVDVGRLKELVGSAEYDRHTIYLVHAKPSDYIAGIDDAPYNRDRYYSSPALYKNLFWDRVAPYLTLFINGAGWAPGFPRLMNGNQLRDALEKAAELPGFRFQNIADISCDVEGGLEFLSKATTLSSPFYDISASDSRLPSVRMMSVDILPASMPLDASVHFSKAFKPHLYDLIGEYKHAYAGAEGTYRGKYTRALDLATIAKGGRLIGGWSDLWWRVKEFAGATSGTGPSEVEEVKPASNSMLLQNKLESISLAWVERAKSKKREKDKSLEREMASVRERKRVLLLGSGMVAKPAVDYLVCKAGVKLVIAGNNPFELDYLARPYKDRSDVEVVGINLDEPSRYEHLVRDADVVVSLLPAFLHVNVAKACIDAGKPLVTASYTSHTMQGLDEQARAKNVLILTEMGLDPGIDHLSAMQMIEDLKGKNKQLLSFVSMCGGLPTPEDAISVPLGYKFSWRPEGVLNAALEEAKWSLGWEFYVIPGTQLLKSYWTGLPITNEFELEGLPNRDSMAYRRLYQLGGMRTFVRGTLRHPGYSSLMSAFASLGLLNNKNKILLEGWNTFVRQAMAVHHSENVAKYGDLPSLPSLLASSAKEGITVEGEQERFEHLRDSLDYLGLTTPGLDPVIRADMPPLPKGPQTPLRIFAYLLAEKLKYRDGEKDMVVLSHELIADNRYNMDERAVEEEVYTSTLITYGTDRMHVGFDGERPASAMARTVGLPAAVAAGMIAYGKLDGKVGVRRPLDQDIYAPVLKELAEMGIEMDEKMRIVKKFEHAGTVEECLRRNMRGDAILDRKVEEQRDLDADQGWVEDEVVEWGSKK